MRTLLCILLIFFVVGCSTQPKSTQRKDHAIDVDELQEKLNLYLEDAEYGFKYVKFNTCEVGAGYPSNYNCRTRYFSVIRFQLLCRDSTGTIDNPVTAKNLHVIASEPIHWTVGNFRKKAYTDKNGFGQARIITYGYPGKRWLRVSYRGEFLAVRVNEAFKFVVPENWCS